MSMLGDLENLRAPDAFSGGNEVCRSGCVGADALDIIEALRRLPAGPEEGISDCLRLRGEGSWAFDGWGGEKAERLLWLGGDAMVAAI